MKKISLVLIIAMLTVVMAACSSKTNTPETKPSSAPESSGSGENANTDPVTLKIVYKDEGSTNPVSVKFFQNLEKALQQDEGLNIKFELVDVAQGSYSENLNLLLLGGTIPDIIYFQGGDQLISD